MSISQDFNMSLSILAWFGNILNLFWKLSVMSPSQNSLDLLEEMISGFSVDGVVDLTWQACHTYNVEAYQIRKFVSEKFSLPCLHIETDYSLSDTEHLRVRIEAFLEMIWPAFIILDAANALWDGDARQRS